VDPAIRFPQQYCMLKIQDSNSLEQVLRSLLRSLDFVRVLAMIFKDVEDCNLCFWFIKTNYKRNKL
jgi:hypothetical protein